MTNFLETGSAGGAGAILGVILSFLGFRSRLDSIEKRLDKTINDSVSSNTCHAVSEGIKDLIDTQTKLMSEMREDIKTLIRRD